jgi:hypothetical protein
MIIGLNLLIEGANNKHSFEINHANHEIKLVRYTTKRNKLINEFYVRKDKFLLILFSLEKFKLFYHITKSLKT